MDEVDYGKTLDELLDKELDVIVEHVLNSGSDPEEPKLTRCRLPENATYTASSPDMPNPDIKEEPQDSSVRQSNILKDFVDEEALKELDATLSVEEKEKRKEDALELKKTGNAFYLEAQYLESLEDYTAALRLCPIEYTNDRAILYCNRAASKLQLWYKDSAIADCTKAVELNPSYVRAYLRRGKLYADLDKLDESLEDYKKVLELDPGNPEAVKANVLLPPKINERNEKLKTEMMGKLKDLGNVILRPFGLSTENFNMQQDPNSGGYSINFKQN